MGRDADKADSGRDERADACAARIVAQTEKLEPFAEQSARRRVGKVIGNAALKAKPRRKPRSS